MLNVIDQPELLWQECSRIARDPKVISSELFNREDDHFVLVYGPVAQRNPFQSLLYSAKDKFNVSLLPIHDLALVGDIPWPSKVICHLHWIHGRTGQAKNEAEADASVIYWSNIIKRIKVNGYKLVWTVHNVMPHESVWFEHDREIHQMMADAADALHIMASDSVKLTQQHYTLSQNKVFVVPHSTYEGAQRDDITRALARSELGIAEEEFVFISFGAILEYKGYHELMSAYDKLCDELEKKTRLIIAGLPSDKQLVEKITSWAKGKPEVILALTAVPSDKLQLYFRSADVAVCPYRRTMNSGAAMMALTFQIPVIAPNVGGFADLVKEKCVCGYSFGDSIELLNTMRESVIGDILPSHEHLILKCNELSPAKISELFFSNLIGSL